MGVPSMMRLMKSTSEECPPFSPPFLNHPIAGGLYYKDQMLEAAARAKDFHEHRLPKFLGYFDRVLEQNPHNSGYLAGDAMSYVDLSIFQLVEGLRYAFPKAMKRIESKHTELVKLHDRIANHPPVARYLASERRIPFNDMEISRHYPGLDK